MHVATCVCVATSNKQRRVLPNSTHCEGKPGAPVRLCFCQASCMQGTASSQKQGAAADTSITPLCFVRCWAQHQLKGLLPCCMVQPTHNLHMSPTERCVKGGAIAGQLETVNPVKQQRLLHSSEFMPAADAMHLSCSQCCCQRGLLPLQLPASPS
jgi:hypothetical protein